MKQQIEEHSSREMEQLAYEDVLVQLNSLLEQYGAREVLKDFHVAYPRMFEELSVQLHRLTPDKRVAALLRPSEGF